MREIIKILKISISLSKIRISTLVALSTLMGYILAANTFDFTGLFAVLGSFILAGGSAALNQVQEWKLDKMMSRTQNRPIPSEQISPKSAFAISITFILLGCFILGVIVNPLVMALGMFNIFWYNGVYTPLKRKTAFAVFPGALIGAVPPAMGWVAAGKPLFDPYIIILGFFFFIWQIPHFWLLLVNIGNDYKNAGFPTLTSKFSDKLIARFTYVWILETVLISFLLPFFGVGNSFFPFALVIGTAIWIIWSNRKLLQLSIPKTMYKSAFMSINIYLLLVMSGLSLQALIWG